MTTVFTWSKWETDEFVTLSEEQRDYYHAAPNCPLCGRRTEETEGQTGQDRMGNDEYSYWYECRHCEISTQFWSID